MSNENVTLEHPVTTHTHTSCVCLNARDLTTTMFMQLLHYLLCTVLYKA